MRRFLASALLLATAFLAPVALGAQSTPVGIWHTISDVDGKPRGIIEIREVDGKLVGTVKGTLVPGEKGDKTCDKCTDERKGQRIVGMEILRGLKPDGDEWNGGEILDPDNGKTYKAKVRLIEGGRKLVVRGYIGFSLLGRSQTWVRAE
ncbi:MAG: DUF2147 domain-containing protein [Gemmatimonadetes bacterium]|nr:DUF2147 domain-containing protein [Gemmatimonadota bacterium]